MAQNRGKQFEKVVREAFEQVPGVSVDRLHDQMNGYAGSQNICDFIVYKKPYEYYFECKSIHGNTLSIHGTDEKHKYGNITNTQWEGLLAKSQIKGVYAGIICWWVDKDVTKFISIQHLQMLYGFGIKSVRYDYENVDVIQVQAKKKRVFFDYDMEGLLNEISIG